MNFAAEFKNTQVGCLNSRGDNPEGANDDHATRTPEKFRPRAVRHGYLSAMAPASRTGRDFPTQAKVLVAIFQRGAVDGLNVVVPHGDRSYAGLRPNIAVRDSLDLDGFFDLSRAGAFEADL